MPSITLGDVSEIIGSPWNLVVATEEKDGKFIFCVSIGPLGDCRRILTSKPFNERSIAISMGKRILGKIVVIATMKFDIDEQITQDSQSVDGLYILNGDLVNQIMRELEQKQTVCTCEMTILHTLC
jgi:hypothetical protein